MLICLLRIPLLALLAALCSSELLGSSVDAPVDKAKEEFPELADPNSIFSKAYAAEEAALRKTQPDFFSNDNWQLMLAYRVAMKLGIGGTSVKASTPPTSPTETSATEDETTAAQRISPFVLTLKGDQGAGSGFVLKRDGKTYLVTNAHVIDGNENIKVGSIDKDFPLPPNILVSKTRDIVMAEVDISEGLVAEDDFSQLAINDATLSLGNSSGAGVSRLIKGKLLGVGNDLIETDAAYVQGNSGSPIIHLKSGKVLGVVTYVEQSPNNSLVANSDLKNLRHFAHRIDNLPANDLVPISTSAFLAESQMVESIDQRNEEIRQAIAIAKKTKGTLPLPYKVYDQLLGKRQYGLNITRMKGWTFEGRAPLGALFVSMDGMPSAAEVRQLHPYHVRKLQPLLKDRLSLLDEIFGGDREYAGKPQVIPSNSNQELRGGHGSVWIKVDKSGNPLDYSWLKKEVDLRQFVKESIAASDIN